MRLLRVELFDFAREPRIEEGCVESRNRSDSGFACDQASPKLFAGVADGRNSSSPVTTTRRRAGGRILERLKTSASYGGVGVVPLPLSLGFALR